MNAKPTTKSKTLTVQLCEKCSLAAYCKTGTGEENDTSHYYCPYHAPSHCPTHVLESVTQEQTRAYTVMAQTAWSEIITMLGNEVYQRKQLAEVKNRPTITRPLVESQKPEPRPKKAKEFIKYWNTSGQPFVDRPLQVDDDGTVVVNANMDDASMSTLVICPECSSVLVERVLVRAPGGMSSKDETWGSDRLDAVEKYTCKSCGHSWHLAR